MLHTMLSPPRGAPHDVVVAAGAPDDVVAGAGAPHDVVVARRCSRRCCRRHRCSTRCCRRRPCSRRCCRRRQCSTRCCRRFAVLHTMLSSSRAPHTTRAPVDVLSEPQRTPCSMRCCRERHAAGDAVVAPDEMTRPRHPVALDGVAHVAEVVVAGDAKNFARRTAPRAFRIPAPWTSKLVLLRSSARCTAESP